MSEIKIPSNEEMKETVIEGLKGIFDPELPVNIYDLGLIYDVACKTDEATQLKACTITMTLTSATCSMSEMIVDLVSSLNMRIDYLETVDWNKAPPGPRVPSEILRRTSDKYQEALDIITKSSD